MRQVIGSFPTKKVTAKGTSFSVIYNVDLG